MFKPKMVLSEDVFPKAICNENTRAYFQKKSDTYFIYNMCFPLTQLIEPPGIAKFTEVFY